MKLNETDRCRFLLNPKIRAFRKFLFRSFGHSGGHSLHGTLFGVAVGTALTMNTLPAFTVFTSIALGLASPYLILSLFPQWLSHLPKPGAWMETFKQFLAFPLYATVVWLVWTLAALL